MGGRCRLWGLLAHAPQCTVTVCVLTPPRLPMQPSPAVRLPVADEHLEGMPFYKAHQELRRRVVEQGMGIREWQC